MAAPATPVNFNLQQGNGNTFLSWDIAAGATSYSIERSTDGVNFSVLTTAVVNNYLDAAVTEGSQYWYKVASVNSSGTSPYTASQNIVPVRQGKMTLGQVRLLSQQRADRVNSNFVTLTEWNQFINQSYFELYDLLTNVYEDWYLADPYVFNTNGAVESYPVPNGVLVDALSGLPAKPFYKLRGLDLGLSSNSNAWVTLKKFDFIERNRYIFPQLTSTYLGVFNLRYRLMGSNILFIPLPAGGQFVRMWYQPRLDTLLKDTDILDGVSGWSEYVIVDAARKALLKEESDTSMLDQEKMMLKGRIEESAINRDIGEPDTISDTARFASKWGGNYGGPNGDGGWGGA